MRRTSIRAMSEAGGRVTTEAHGRMIIAAETATARRTTPTGTTTAAVRRTTRTATAIAAVLRTTRIATTTAAAPTATRPATRHGDARTTPPATTARCSRRRIAIAADPSIAEAPA